MNIDGILIPEEFEGYAALSDTELRILKKPGSQFIDEIERNSRR
jgi:hypothetical protein